MSSSTRALSLLPLCSPRSLDFQPWICCFIHTRWPPSLKASKTHMTKFKSGVYSWTTTELSSRLLFLVSRKTIFFRRPFHTEPCDTRHPNPPPPKGTNFQELIHSPMPEVSSALHKKTACHSSPHFKKVIPSFVYWVV